MPLWWNTATWTGTDTSVYNTATRPVTVHVCYWFQTINVMQHRDKHSKFQLAASYSGRETCQNKRRHEATCDRTEINTRQCKRDFTSKRVISSPSCKQFCKRPTSKMFWDIYQMSMVKNMKASVLENTYVCQTEISSVHIRTSNSIIVFIGWVFTENHIIYDGCHYIRYPTLSNIFMQV